MSLAKREEILTRLFVIAQAIANDVTNEIEAAFRNRGLLDQDKRPCIALMDGDEENSLSPVQTGRVRMSPSIMRMTPQVYIILKNKKPKNDNIGTELNTLRGVVIRAIATDADLLTLIGGNGTIQYLGCETDLKSGELAEGQMRLDFELRYAFNPNS
jgi:hypothetical protein